MGHGRIIIYKLQALDEKSGYWFMTNTSTNSDKVNSEPYSLSVSIIKNSYTESQGATSSYSCHKILQEGLNKYLTGNKNFQLNILVKQIICSSTTGSHRCHCKPSSGCAKWSQLLVTKNIHQYGLSRKWKLKCSAEIYSSYYPIYFPYFTFRLALFFSLNQGWQSCSLPCLQPGHLWSAGYIIHAHSLNLKSEMRASIEQTLCWPLLQTALSSFILLLLCCNN